MSFHLSRFPGSLEPEGSFSTSRYEDLSTVGEGGFPFEGGGNRGAPAAEDLRSGPGILKNPGWMIHAKRPVRFFLQKRKVPGDKKLINPLRTVHCRRSEVIMSSAIRNAQENFAFFIPLLVSAIIILFWLISLAFMTLRRGSGAGLWGLFEIIVLLATIVAPVIYGWKTCDTNGAVLTGVLPFLFVMTVARVVSGELFPDTPSYVNSILYPAGLCIIGGLEGYFASRHEKKSLGIAIILAGAWFWFFLSGIH